MRTGIGYDIHPLKEGRRLILGGVQISYQKGLDGHSDADVLLHAICDALLGAIGCGDIGEHFPDTDERFKDISSQKLLKEVNSLLRHRGFLALCVDATILAEEPHLNPYRQQMKTNIAHCLEISEERINVKVTTSEGLGPIGQRQAMAALCVVSVEEINTE